MSFPRGQSFGALLKHLRLAAALTQEELAEQADISVRAISELERGANQYPRKDTAQMLADGLGLEGEARDAFLAAARRPRSSELPLAGEGDSARRVHLPIPPNVLLGREDAVAAACAAVSASGVRLLTLTGPGGVGKTRLALEVAARLADRFVRVHFLSLAPIDDPTLVIPLIGQAIGVQDAGDSPHFSALREALDEVPTLLALDNFEHLVSAAPAVATLLAACPQLSVLVTSRSALRVQAEREIPVEPLMLPPVGRVDDDHDLLAYPALALFVARAASTSPRFAVTPESAPTLAQICHRLDGLPLAIELAAAHVKVLSLESILERLTRSFDLLARGARDSPPRQQTMHATIDWSYDLLSPPEQMLFRRIAVLANGFTLEAAEAMVNVGGQPESDVLSEFGALTDKSLIYRLAWPGEPRFGMLETIREFALNQLHVAGELEAVRQAHAEFMGSVVEAIQANWADSRQEAVLDDLAREHDNVRAALSWALRRGEIEMALRLTGPVAKFWYLRGHWAEGRKWLSQVLARAPKMQSLDYARSYLVAGTLAEAQGDLEMARTHYEQARAVFLALDYSPGLCRVINNLGNVLSALGQGAEARERYEEALAICRDAGETQGIAQALQNLGIVAALQGQRDVAAPLLSESLALFRQLGDRFGISSGLTNLASLAFREGNLELARGQCAEALALIQGLGDPQGEAAALVVLGEITQQESEFALAEASFEKALTLFQELGDLLGEAAALAGLGGVALRDRDDRQHAKQLLREAIARFTQLGEKEQVAWCLEELATVLLRGEQWPLAARLLGAADALLLEIDIPRAPVYVAEHDRAMATVKSALGALSFHVEWEAGASTPIAQIIASIEENEDHGI